MSERRPSVHVVDDDPSIRQALDSLLRSADYRIRVFESAEAFLAALPQSRPDCLVLDVQLPDLNGLELQAQLLERGAMIPIVFITGEGSIPMTVRAMKAGAIEFFPKPLHPSEFLLGVEQAILRSQANRQSEETVSELRSAYASLSPREREVMTLVVAGRLNKQVAAQLGTQETTVKRQRAHLMRKMGAASIAELVRMAARLGLDQGE